ncbi:sigma-54-dependent Fis family transcriptional regulator [Sphingomonas koreensis]|jgi:two-component system C4-dicarboxylate transport response regulator DctD|uniref:Fis family transcriptional regulator n=1 Tax=Sphingomonas koreensis TaxID=93064 RepID=A0A1L6JAQ6_9SPHN|nr:sigma-54 dependent transcriptional regulator [Sphingomonas koreensis]APR53009.1 Fis family transcriptional regulator [Sphingomonas koreensis]MDC7811371.1 sigma-54 dependent transcriptional regulator [Sphingomonas koreensis]PJI87384.1 two-component system C4-dicarboxylate transport response regulator DctD [Sphingomonas koreensis]RSU18202.1 sigma-54-dependent Fis family transcriptional regulator [Sphingomonas koreensis]RSU23512.1 sigma-54-dependent Fis family transcriptional regulator [Sphing
MAEPALLFVDDDAALREANVQTLELAGLAVRPFASAQAALGAITPDFAGAVITDIRMPGMDGMQFFERIRAIDPEIPVILITGHGDVPMAVRALQDGAFDFLAKPFAAGHLAASASKALAARGLVLDNRRLRADTATRTESPLIGDSPAMVRLRETIAQVARADIDVLIEGETGTGKELVAAMLHRGSPRSARPFVAVSCAALPEAHAEIELLGHAADAVPGARFARTGRIEASSRGTLFLDDIDGMPLAVQSRLLRVIEEREVLPLGEERPIPLDLRVIASVKPGLDALIERGEFRRDLYFRLNVVRLSLPPLRERRADIPLLFAAFVQEASAQAGRSDFRITDTIRRHLIGHDWPGNVRELRNFAFSAALGLTEPGIWESEAQEGLVQRVRSYEEMLLREALQAANGRVDRALQLLRLPRKTLYDKMKRAGITPADFRLPKGGR